MCGPEHVLSTFGSLLLPSSSLPHGPVRDSSSLTQDYAAAPLVVLVLSLLHPYTTFTGHQGHL